jgi:anti-sigma factor RsiW
MRWMGLADRDWWREASTEVEASRRAPVRVKRRGATKGSASRVASAAIVSAALTLALSHLSWLRAHLRAPAGTSTQTIPVRVWIPAAKHGHAAVIHVTVTTRR